MVPRNGGKRESRSKLQSSFDFKSAVIQSPILKTITQEKTMAYIFLVERDDWKNGTTKVLSDVQALKLITQCGMRDDEAQNKLDELKNDPENTNHRISPNNKFYGGLLFWDDDC